MKFPVYFIPLEEEIGTAIPYLKGRVLNAGCGERDISDFLKSKYAASVDNCDIQTSIPNSFLCDLTNIPKADASYDAILCNAVLEHVPYPEKVMEEFYRLLATGGHLVISVPFLQPFHPTPYDFRRYTKSGIEQIAEKSGFEVIQISSVHTIAQTLGWIFWTYLEENNNFMGKILFWIPIYIWSRVSRREKNDNNFASNGFQAVLLKS